MAIDPDLARKHYMNPAYGRAVEQGDAHGPEAGVEPIGTKLSGYARAEDGPFECGNCVHFWREDSTCSHPVVVNDPEVEKRHGHGVVEEEGCCNYFRPGNQEVRKPGS